SAEANRPAKSTLGNRGLSLNFASSWFRDCPRFPPARRRERSEPGVSSIAGALGRPVSDILVHSRVGADFDATRLDSIGACQPFDLCHEVRLSHPRKKPVPELSLVLTTVVPSPHLDGFIEFHVVRCPE